MSGLIMTNNIRVAVTAFVLGIFFALPAAALLVYNGVQLGAAFGLTQAQVADTLGMSQQAYRKFEMPGKSNPTLRSLRRLSEVLGLELSLRAA